MLRGKRTVRVVSSQFDRPRSLESQATTWGELQKEMIAQTDPIHFEEMSVVVRQTKVSLVDDNAVLPEESFDLFLSPAKVKSGGNC